MSEEKMWPALIISSSFFFFLQGSGLVASHFVSHQNVFGGCTDLIINASVGEGQKMWTSISSPTQ